MPHFWVDPPRYEAVPILALSGTAPPKRQKFIRHSLKLQNPLRCWIELMAGALNFVWNTLLELLFELIWYIWY